MREALRLRRYSRRTEEAYVAWARRFILFHGKRHPSELGAPEVTAFLTSLAVDGRVAASTQNQALSALLFLYRDVLEAELPWLDGVVRARRPQRLPVVLTRDEVRAVLQQIEGVPRLMACLLYGAGLRVLECCRLRVQDVDLASNQVGGDLGSAQGSRESQEAQGILRGSEYCAGRSSGDHGRRPGSLDRRGPVDHVRPVESAPAPCGVPYRRGRNHSHHQRTGGDTPRT
jgi:integrase